VLVLISIGLADERDMSLRALEAARECDILLSEFYTNKINTNTEKLSKLIGKPVREISRKDLEENFNWILEEAKNKNVGILVGGDCLVATTHYSIVLEAKKLEIPVKIIHGSSIISAIGETGLHLKKFGPYVTIPFPEKTKKSLPESVYNMQKTDLLIFTTTQYPNAGFDMFWVDNGLTLKNGGLPKNAEQTESHLGRQWRRFSYHPYQNKKWNPAEDSVVVFIQHVEQRLKNGD